MNKPQKITNSKLLSGEKLIWLFAGVYCLSIFFFLREKTLNGHDTANYFLAIKYGFSLAAERPHAPGYPFFVVLEQLLSSSFSIDPHTALIVFADIFLFFGIVVCYKFVKKYWGGTVAVIAILLVASNPVVLFYGSVAENYVYDLFFCTGILYLALACKPKFTPLVFFLLGIAMGFRLSSVILLAPAIATAFYFRSDKKEVFLLKNIFLSFILLIVGILLWAFPFYISQGGFGALFQALHDAGELESMVYQNAATYASYFLWAFNAGLFIFLLRTKQPTQKQKKILLAVWFIFPTLFFIFEHYSKGYIILTLPAMLIPIAGRISNFKNITSQRAVTALLVLVNLSLFFFMPFIPLPPESSLPKAQRSSSERIKTAFFRSLSFFAPTYSHIAKADIAMMEANSMIEKNCPPLSMTCIDKSADLWAYPRSLQASHPMQYFIRENKNDTLTVSLFYGKDVDRRYLAQNIIMHDTLFYLIGTEFVRSYGTPTDAILLESGPHVSLYKIAAKDKNHFWKYFTEKIR